MAQEEHLTKACERGGSIDRVALFRHLRKAWLEKNKTTALNDLCSYLGIAKSTVSSYATGNDRRSAPWWALLRLLASLRLELRINEDGIVVGRRVLPRKHDMVIPHAFEGKPLALPEWAVDEAAG